MRVTHIETHLVQVPLGRGNWVYTILHTDEDMIGISEVTARRWERTIEQGIHEVGAYLIGKDPTCIEDLWEKLYRDSFWVGGPLHATCITALEWAMWDLLGKSLDVPVYKLLGGPTRERVRVYAHAHGDTPEGLAQAGKAAVEQGYTMLKTRIRPGKEPRRKETEGMTIQAYQTIRNNLAALREAVGPGVDIAVDAHGCLSSGDAMRVAADLKEFDVLFFEEPVPPENIEALALVAHNSPVPIATGERFATVYGFREVLAKQAASVIQPDVCNVGGLSQAKKVAGMAEAHYVSVAPHNPNGPLATVMNLHFAAVIPNFLVLETTGDVGHTHAAAALIDGYPDLADGHLPIPQGPGLGVSLNLDEFKKYSYQPVTDMTR